MSKTLTVHHCRDGCADSAGDAHSTCRIQGVRRIDFHCHVLVQDVEIAVEAFPEKQKERSSLQELIGEESLVRNEALLQAVRGPLTSADCRLADMERLGIDLQVLSPSPTQYYYWAQQDLAERLVRLQNESIAAMCARYPNRFVGLGGVALQHPDLAVAQLCYAVQELGLKGVEIGATVNGLEIADPRLLPFWRAAEELGAVVFLHPLGTSLGARVRRYYLSNLIGIPLETTIALSHLIFGGVLDLFPKLRICAAHGGGFMASYVGRFDHGWEVRPECKGAAERPSDYLRRVFHDTVLFRAEDLRHLIATVGVQQVVLGTDYPFDMGNHRAVELISNLHGELSDHEMSCLLGGNAARLLSL